MLEYKYDEIDTEEKFVWKITKTIDDDYYKLSKD